jgi:hypothetical protein
MSDNKEAFPLPEFANTLFRENILLTKENINEVKKHLNHYAAVRFENINRMEPIKKIDFFKKLKEHAFDQPFELDLSNVTHVKSIYDEVILLGYKPNLVIYLREKVYEEFNIKAKKDLNVPAFDSETYSSSVRSRTVDEADIAEGKYRKISVRPIVTMVTSPSSTSMLFL